MGCTFDLVQKMEGNQSFWRQMAEAVAVGIRDIRTGDDRVLAEWLDPRLTTGFSLDFALTRGLALAWRAPEGKQALPVRVLGGTVDGGALRIREIPMGAWPSMADVLCSADGASCQTTFGSRSRKLRVTGGADSLQSLFDLEGMGGSGLLPGTLSFLVGHPGEDLFLRKATEKALGAPILEEVVILLLYAADPGPVGVGETGGPMRNLWRLDTHAVKHLNDGHLTEFARKMLFEHIPDPWNDEEYRARLFEALQASAQEKGKAVTQRMFLDVLAEASPLRQMLPAMMGRYFKEVEQIFYCQGDKLWDHSSPTERLALLADKVARERGEQSSESDN